MSGHKPWREIKMKSEYPKKTVIEQTRWDCGNPEHRHKTEDVASRCYKKRMRAEANKRLRAAPTNTKTPAARTYGSTRLVDFMMANLIVLGFTLEEIGEVFNITQERVRQIYYKMQRKAMWPNYSRVEIRDSRFDTRLLDVFRAFLEQEKAKSRSPQ